MVSIGASIGRAAAAFHLTYTIGDTLYVPLSSQCQLNQLTSLPQSRGDGFTLPMDVIAALQNMRKVEGFHCTWNPSPTSSGKGLLRDYLPPIQHSINNEEIDDSLDYLLNNWSAFSSIERNSPASNERAHLSEAILNEIVDKCFSENQDTSTIKIAFAGEGEPLIYPNELLWLSNKISLLAQNLHRDLNLRVVTNGIVHPSAAKTLFDHGVTGVSVALMTANREQYQDMMNTKDLDEILSANGGDNKKNELCATSHDQVCKFIENAYLCGLDVELTGVDRIDVEKSSTEKLGESLGIKSSRFRWRPYFP